jgi:hypothetical protein
MLSHWVMMRLRRITTKVIIVVEGDEERVGKSMEIFLLSRMLWARVLLRASRHF